MANMTYEELLFTSIKNGQTSKSVYDIWVEIGNQGTPADFLESLKGSTAIVTKGVTIAVADWIPYNGIYKATVSNELITSDSVVNVSFDAVSIDAAITNGILGYTNSIEGAFEIYSNFLPTSDLIIDYAVINS